MLKPIIAIAALAVAGTANAAVLFSDDFESDTPALAITTSLANWTVTGNVDVVGMPNGFGITCAGNCVDLDGTTGPGRITSSAIAYSGGSPVTVSFDMSGSQRASATDAFRFTILFGAEIDTGAITYDLPGLGSGSLPSANTAGLSVLTGVPGGNPWASYFLTFNPAASGTFQIQFDTLSSDNIGPLVDNVRVTQGVVPEPATWAMLIAGFGLVGTAMRRRRALAA